MLVFQLKHFASQNFTNHNDSSGECCQERCLFAAVDAIFCCDWHVTHTHRNVTNQPKYGKIIINCGLTILIVSLFCLGRLRIMAQLRSGAVDKMAGTFTKRIWKPCICQPNDLKIKKKTGGYKWGETKMWGRAWPTRPSLRIVTDQNAWSLIVAHFLSSATRHLQTTHSNYKEESNRHWSMSGI